MKTSIWILIGSFGWLYWRGLKRCWAIVAGAGDANKKGPRWRPSNARIRNRLCLARLRMHNYDDEAVAHVASPKGLNRGILFPSPSVNLSVEGKNYPDAVILLWRGNTWPEWKLLTNPSKLPFRIAPCIAFGIFRRVFC